MRYPLGIDLMAGDSNLTVLRGTLDHGEPPRAPIRTLDAICRLILSLE
jgi:hypothetical protein